MKDVDNRVQFGIKFGKSRGFLKSGDPIAIVRSSLFFGVDKIIYWFIPSQVTGWKSGSGFTNTLRVVYVDDNFGGFNI